MWVILPVAGISMSLPLLIGVGALVGFLSGVFGVGGGFLLTPLLMIMGIPATVAAASGSCQMVAASSSGTAAHFRLGNVDTKLGSLLLVGGLAGAGLGVHIIKVLRSLGDADFVITSTYVVVLAGMGGYMFWDSLRTLRHGVMAPRARKAAVGRGFLHRLPFQMDFPRSGVRHSVLVPLFLCGLVGILAAIMGVGGGFIMVPMMVYLLRMPMHVAVGTDLFQILFTCAGVTYMQASTNHTVDAMLALLLALGSAGGAQIGARVSRHLRGEQLIILLATMVLLVAGEMLTSLMLPPSIHLRSLESRARQAAPQAVALAANSFREEHLSIAELAKEKHLCRFFCP
jgi:uncharacterized membrane protein YfcA